MVKLRAFLSDWPFWVGVAYFGLVAVVVALYFLSGRTSRAQATAAREQAVRLTSVSAAAKADAAARRARVAQCKTSRPQLIKIQKFVDGVAQFHRIVAKNSLAIVNATPRTDPQYEVRLNNYRRIVRTVADVSGVTFHIPTIAECDRLGHP